MSCTILIDLVNGTKAETSANVSSKVQRKYIFGEFEFIYKRVFILSSLIGYVREFNLSCLGFDTKL